MVLGLPALFWNISALLCSTSQLECNVAQLESWPASKARAIAGERRERPDHCPPPAMSHSPATPAAFPAPSALSPSPPPAAASDSSLPVRLWGLDPSYWSCLKLFARDVIELDVHPKLPDCLVMRCAPAATRAVSKGEQTGTAADNRGIDGSISMRPPPVLTRPVSKVEVMGVVVGVKHNRDKGVEYLIDDGTTVLSCMCWYATTAVAAASLGSGLLSSSALYRDLPTVSTAFVSTPFHTLAMGAVARVRGRPSCYREQRQVNVESMYIEVDPNAETLHWLECMQLKKTVYDQPRSAANATQQRTH